MCQALSSRCSEVLLPTTSIASARPSSPLSHLASPADKMSYITKRALSTLIPPKVASPNAIGSSPNALRMQKVVSFYEKLPRGAAPEVQAKGLLGRYQKRYFGKNASAMPLVHVIGALIALGYAQNYYFHLRHHKNNVHH